MFGSIALMLFATWLLRKRVSEDVHNANNQFAGTMFAALATLYGVLLAFIVVAEWQEYQDTRGIVQMEANAVMNLYRFSWEMPAPYDYEIRSLVKTYIKNVIHDEWVMMQHGASSPSVEAQIESLWTIHRSIHTNKIEMPSDTGSMYDAITELTDARRMRLEESRAELPRLIWILLWGGGIIVLGYALFLRSPNERAHYLMIALATALIAFVLFLIVELDEPFLGEISVSPRPFERILVTIEQIEGK